MIRAIRVPSMIRVPSISKVDGDLIDCSVLAVLFSSRPRLGR
jgi:hypothetical protein